LSTAKNTTALDYYLSGIKIDPVNIGCAYNVACTFYEEKMFCNSLKWFNLAQRLISDNPDVLFGTAVVQLKLGRF
jgi:hypothetical protein